MLTRMTRRRHRRSAARVTVVGLAILSLIVTSSSPAQATYYEGGMPSIRFNYRTHGINDVWVAHYDTGNIRWNQRVSSAIGRSSSAAADATAGSYPNSWYGEYNSHGRRHINRTFTIRLNSRTLVADFGSNATMLRRQSQVTATHELGHALSLADNPDTRSRSVMKYADIDNLTVEVPQPYDIGEVARIY